MMESASRPCPPWAVAIFRVTTLQRSAVNGTPHSPSYEVYSRERSFTRCPSVGLFLLIN